MLGIFLAAILAVLGIAAQAPRLMALPTIGVTIDGGTVTSQLMSASWNLGISDFLSDLAPNTASLSFKGQLSVSPADAVVITAGGTAMWTGRLDTYVETRDVNGDYWSSVTATDAIGALGAAELDGYTMTAGSMETIGEDAASDAGVTLDILDTCSRGLVEIQNGDLEFNTYSGQLLPYLNELAKSSNAMLALQRDGTVAAWSRQSLYSPDVSNGTFDVNTTGWSSLNSGTISRVTASPHTGAGNLRIVTGTNAYGGGSSTITGTFRKGHTYHLALWARTISGSASVQLGLGMTGGVDESTSTPTLTGSWAEYTIDWTPTADRTNPLVYGSNPNSTSTRTFELDDVAVTEIVNATDISASIVTWEKTTSIDSNINVWTRYDPAPLWFEHATDPATYGRRTFNADHFTADNDLGGVDGVLYPFYTWASATGGVRPVVTNGELVVTSSTSPLLALDPLDWVNDGTDDWQIMSMSWSVVPGEPWRLTITADNLIALL